MTPSQSFSRRMVVLSVFGNLGGALLTFLYFHHVDPMAVEGGAAVRRGEIAFFALAFAVLSYIGDLTVTLVSPAGARVALHSRSGGSRDNIVTTYKSSAIPALAALRGQAMQGTWKLQVIDLDAADVGKLNRWGLKIAG